MTESYLFWSQIALLFTAGLALALALVLVCAVIGVTRWLTNQVDRAHHVIDNAPTESSRCPTSDRLPTWKD